MSVADAAEYVGVSERTIRDLVRDGQLTHYRIGRGRGFVRFRRSEIDEYLARRRREASAA